MSDIAEAVQAIRAFLRNTAAQPDESVRLAGETYREHHAAASLRMRQCIFYLERDRISEAVHLASQEPSLLQSCAHLLFPEADEWIAQATINNLPAPAGYISHADVERLNLAFLREENTTGLLRLHRRRALVRAPLAQRIEVLRRLADIDPLVSGWRDDQKQLESLRLEEINEALPGVLKRKDSAEIETYEKELYSESWLINPPPSWLASLRLAKEEILSKQVQAEFMQLAMALDAAFQAHDISEGFARLREWERLLMTGVPQPQAVNLAQSALSWLEQEIRNQEKIAAFDQALRALNLAIRTNQSEEAILQRLREAEALGDVPTGLVKAVKKAIEKDRMRRRRHRRIKMIVILLFIVGLAGGGWMYWRQRAVNDILKQTENELKIGRFEEALSLLNRFNLSHPSWAGVDEVKQRLEEIEQRLAEKRAEEKAKVEEERAKEENRLGQLNDARTILIDMTVKGDFSRIDTAIETVRRLAVTNKEKQEIEQLVSAAREARTTLLRRQEGLHHQLGRWRADLRLRENLSEQTPPEQLLKEAEVLAKLANEITRTIEESSQTIGDAGWIAEAEGIRGEMEALAKILSIKGNELQNFAQIWNTLAENFTPEGLRQSIVAAMQHHPELSEINHVQDAGRVASAVMQLVPLSEFETILRAWLEQDMAPDALFPDAKDEYSRGEAGIVLKKRWESLRSSLRLFGRTREQDQAVGHAVDAALHLSALQRGTSAFHSARKAFLEYGKTVENYWEIRSSNGTVSPFLYAVSPPDAETKTAQVLSNTGVTQTAYNEARLAPHAEFFLKSREVVEGYPGQDWQFSLQQLSLNCFDTDMDPFPQAMLTFHLLNLAAWGSNELERGQLLAVCRELEELLEQSGLRDRWLNADVPQVSAAKKKMREELDFLRPDIVNLVMEARHRVDSLIQDFPIGRRLVGILGPVDLVSGNHRLLPISGEDDGMGWASSMLFAEEGIFMPVSKIQHGSGIPAAEGYGAGTTVWR